MLNIDDLHADGGRPRRRQHPRRRSAHDLAEALRDACCCGCSPSCSSGCPRSAIPRSRGSCSSSTKRICCSPMRREALLEKIEQVVRLIRSKGVGVYFVTQNPLDIPDAVLGQLGNRVQHALRAFTPRDQKAVKAAAETMRPNPDVRDRAGHHGARRRRGARVAARREGPARRHRARADRAARQPLGPLADAERARLIAASPLAGVYEKSRRSRVGVREAEGRAAETPPQRRAARREATRRQSAATRAAQRRRQSCLRHPVRPARPARRPPIARAHRSDGEERGALRRARKPAAR